MVLLFCVLGGALGAFAESERGVSPDLKMVHNVGGH